MHVTLRFNHPEDVDLHQLAILTEKSFEVLQPWCHAENQSVSLQKITQQARAYVRAIRSSVAAAQHGYDVSNDAFTMAQSIKGDEPKEELDQFAMSMMLSAQGAHVDAEESLGNFRDVRQVLGQLIEEAKTSDEHLEIDIEGHLRPLEEGIPVFENLYKNISEYISWWNWKEMSTKSQVENATHLSVKYGTMRARSVVRAWEDLRGDFVKYKEEIARLEDTYPIMFSEAIKASKSKRRLLRFRWWNMEPLLVLVSRLLALPHRVAVSYPRHNREARSESEGVDDITQVRTESPRIWDCEDIDQPSNLRGDDIIILIMGASGTGKSNLIDTLTGQSGKRVGHGLQSCTSEVSGVRIKSHPQHGSRIVLVDTPGFSDTYKTDFEILEIISNWLMQLATGVFLSGILHLRSITDGRLTGSNRQEMAMFTEFCGKEAAEIVYFVTTGWDEETKEIGEQREAELREDHWRQMVCDGASTARFLNTPESAWEVIEPILSRLPMAAIMLELQQEIVNLKRTLNQTKAAQALCDQSPASRA